MNNLEQKQATQLIVHHVTYTLLYLLIFSKKLEGMLFLKAFLGCHKMKIHTTL